MLTMFGYLWPRYFGRAHLGSIQGVGQMLGVVGASIAPIPVGLAIDTVGSASTTLRLLALVAIIVAIIVLLQLQTPKALEVADRLE